jgi:hypothetical protein
MRIFPDDYFITDVNILMRVDFPAPLCPNKQFISPLLKIMLMSFKA